MINLMAVTQEQKTGPRDAQNYITATSD